MAPKKVFAGARLRALRVQHKLTQGELAARLDEFAATGTLQGIDHADTDKSCRKLVKMLGEAGLLKAATGDAGKTVIDSRAICLTRETLGFHDGLADFAFAMQGLGTGAIGLAGSDELKQAILPKVTSGDWLSAFALSEENAGSA